MIVPFKMKRFWQGHRLFWGGLLSFAFFWHSELHAQYAKEVAPLPIYDGSEPVMLPFLGGINLPKPTFLDFDRDGRIDLFYGEPEGKLVWLRNVGTPAAPSWELASSRFAGLFIGTWYAFCDIDADNDYDLFCDSRGGTVLYYRNESSGADLTFVLKDSEFGDFITQANNTPVFSDIDGDLDFDFFAGNIGGNLEFHENVGDRFTPQYVFVTAFYDSVIAFPTGGGSRIPPQAMHGNNGISFSDIDGDQDFDLFWGDINSTSLYYFGNAGTSTDSDLRWVSEDYLAPPTLGHNHTTFADMDNDGDLEMLVGVANFGADIDNFRLYRNVGSAISPNLILESTNYIRTFDVGSDARVEIGDVDGDTDPDMIVGALDGRMVFLRNTGSLLSPHFVKEAERFGDLTPGLTPAPELCDLDSDGDFDLLVGVSGGAIKYYRNIGDNQSFSYELVSADYLRTALPPPNKLVDDLAITRAADFNDDGKLDIIVGEWDFNGRANVLLFENSGTLTEPNFVLRTRKILDNGPLREFTLPQPHDLDEDGRIDILLGLRGEGIQWYRNLTAVGQFPDSTTLVRQPALLPGSDEGWRLVVSPVDIDGDADDDLIISEESGGLNFFRRTGGCCVGTRGNVDGQAEVDIADLTVLIDHLFISNAPLPCPVAADIQDIGAGSIDIGDLQILIDHLFISQAPLPSCN